MDTSGSSFLGQLIPAPVNQGLKSQEISEISKLILDLGVNKVELFITSANALKIQASKDAVTKWLAELFPGKNLIIVEEGHEACSDVPEQPHGEEITKQGASNRLKNMKALIAQKMNINDNILRTAISLENGLIFEKVNNVKNPAIFSVDEQYVWIDRSFVVGEIWLNCKTWNISAISEGVTTPKFEVLQAEQTGWTQTAGSFIAKKYGWNAKDWHGSICGKGRQIIMTETIRKAFGSVANVMNNRGRVALPAKMSEFKADVHHQYVTEPVDFFVPTDIKKMLDSEKQLDVISDDSEIWRSIYNQIPQPDKLGADGLTCANSNGIILTEDLLVGYFDEVDGKDVLYIVLLWAKKDGCSKEQGWVLPGKRDRAYDKTKGDISIEDANYSLVEKEIGMERSSVAYHVVLAYFDDRKREQRMKSSGFFSFVLLNKKPQLIASKRIGIPLNGLVQLAKREIVIPYDSENQLDANNQFDSNNHFGLVRNHDSLLLNIFETAKFFHVMEKIKRHRIKYKQQLITNPGMPIPNIPDLDNGYECPICMDLMVGTKTICENGHCICGICLKNILAVRGTVYCPLCRSSLLPKPIANIVLEGIVQSQYPSQYAEKFQILSGQQPRTWKDDEIFNGGYIQYY